MAEHGAPAAAGDVAPPALGRRPGGASAAPETEARRPSGPVPAPANTPGRCVLCDVPYTSWEAHRGVPAHAARVAICQTFVMPDRSDSILQQLGKHVQLDFRAVDGVTADKVRRRHGRLSSTLRYLADAGVLTHSLPFSSSAALASPAEGRGAVGPGVHAPEDSHVGLRSAQQGVAPSPPSGAGEWRVGDLCMSFALNGDGYARQEVMDRTARLMPSISAAELAAVTAFILSPRHLARLYDELDMAELLPLQPPAANGGMSGEDGPGPNRAEGQAFPRGGEGVVATCAAAPCAVSPQRGSLARTPTRLGRREERALVVLACLGELAHYSRQDRSRSVADHSTAERLVRHVLATHAMENIVSELVHSVLQRTVADGTFVWRTFQDQVRSTSAAQENGRPGGEPEAGVAPATLALESSRTLFSALAFDSTVQSGAALQVMHSQLRAFLPLERAGTGSTAVGSKQNRFTPAVGEATTYAMPVWQTVIAGVGAAGDHSGATCAMAHPKLAPRRSV